MGTSTAREGIETFARFPFDGCDELAMIVSADDSTPIGPDASNSRAVTFHEVAVSVSADDLVSGSVVSEGTTRSYQIRSSLGVAPDDAAFALGRFSDECELGRTNNAQLVARHRLQGSKAALGLVRAAYLTVYPDSRLCELILPTAGGSEPPTCGRGKVDGFSDDSRRRLMRLLHTLKRSANNPAFVTLTFPDSLIPSPRAAKRAIQTLFKRWARRSPQLCAIWRLEAHPERSDALGMPVPHFHLLVWGAWIDRYELSLDWARVVDAPEFAAHLAAGTKVESIRSFRGVCSYASKYISKASAVSLGDGAGRVWGIFNREAMPIGEAQTIQLDTAQTVRLVRHCKRLLASRGVETEYMCRSIYCEAPGDFLRLLE